MEEDEIILDIEQPDYLQKILIIGNSGVGKSSLLIRFTENTFSPGYISTIGVDFKIRVIEVDGKVVKMQIWDTAGQERFKTITSSYFRGAHGIFIVYDVTDPASFAAVTHWLTEISKYCEGTELSKILIGNKVDKQGRQITSQQGKELAEKLKLTLIETSAMESVNVESAFYTIAKEVKDRTVQNALNAPTGEVHLDGLADEQACVSC